MGKLKHISSLLRFTAASRGSVSSFPNKNISCHQNIHRVLSTSHGLCYSDVGRKIVEDEDDNDRALKELDITLLKPHPEWRNSAAGPIFRQNFHEILWGKWKSEHTAEHHKKEFDEAWENYIEKYGFTPSEYFDSSEYHDRYEGQLIWKNYVRNKKGSIQKQQTRWHCFNEDGEIDTGSPCPLCRDENVLLTYHNIPLLKQFIDAQTGEIQHPLRTGACRYKHARLETCIRLAQSLGYLPKVNYFYNFSPEQMVTKSAHAI